MLRSHLRRAAYVVTAGLLLTGAACSTGSTSAGDAAPSATTTAEADAFPVTIESSYGTATIAEEPTRVVTLGPDADVALSLGVAPIAAEKITWGAKTETGSTVWFDEALAEMDGASAPQMLDTTDGVKTDEIIALEPDLVLATNSGLTQQEYDALAAADIPVVAHPGAMWTTTWQQSLELGGQALGRTALAAEVTDETQAALAGASEEYPVLDGASFLFAWFDPSDLSQVGIYTAEDNRVRVLEELGLVVPDHVKEDSPEGAFYYNVSMENASTLTGDVLLTYATSEDEVEALRTHPLISRIPAVESSKVYADLTESDSHGLSAPSPLAIPYALEHYVPKLAAVLEGQE